jgi:hypothetical protein
MAVRIIEHVQWRWALHDRLGPAARVVGVRFYGVNATVLPSPLPLASLPAFDRVYQVRNTPSRPRSWADFSLL